MFANKKNKEIISFMGGTLISLDHVDDSVFSERMMGDGFAIIPTSDEVYAPFDGEITALFPTGHAYGITHSSGYEVIIHLGIDTVELEGAGFKSLVSKGQKVKQGDVLGTMDIDYLINKSVDITSMMIFTSGETVTILKENEMIQPKEKNIVKVDGKK